MKRKSILKWFVIFMLLSLLLCACGKQEESTAATEESGYSHSIRSTDCDRNFSIGFGQFGVCSTEDTLYFVGDPVRDAGAWIWFSDRKTGLTMPLCGKADCSHSGSTCNAYFAGKFYCLSAYDGKLFWLGRDQLGIFHMYSCEPDGTDHKEYAIENNELLQSITSGMTAFIHRGYTYFYGECSVVKNGEPSMESALVRCPVRGGAAENVVYEPYNGAAFVAQPYGDSVFLVCTKSRTFEDHTVEITRIDCTTLEKKLLCSEKCGFVNGMWVAENGVYLSCADATKLHFFDFAAQKITVPFDLDPDEAYLRQLDFGDNKVIAMEREGSFDLLVTDFEGNTLLQKSYDLEISKKMQDRYSYIAKTQGTDSENIYIYFREFSRESDSSLMRFPLDGSDPVVLWSDNN